MCLDAMLDDDGIYRCAIVDEGVCSLLLISSEAVVVLQVQALSGHHRWVENLESDDEWFLL